MDGLQRGKRILFLTPQFPYPPEQGTALRNYNIIAQVARHHRVTLLTFAPDPMPTAAWPLAGLCEIHTVALPQRSIFDRLRTLMTTTQPDMAQRLASAIFAERLRELVTSQPFDFIQIEGVEMAPYGLMVQRWLGAASPRLIYDAHNAEYLMQKRAMLSDLRQPKRWLAAAYSLVQWRRLTAYERRLCHLCQGLVCCSDADAGALRRLAPECEPYVVPNGVDAQRYHPNLPDSLPLDHPSLVFTGKMDFRPNVDAMLWFCHNVWPQVKAARPDARFYIVGQSPHRALEPLARMPGIEITGYVPDILPYFGGADVYVVPLRVGGGTRLKVLEAMAAGCALVSTALGVEGIELEPQCHALLADTPDLFAQHILALLNDAQQRRELGQRARDFAVKRYDWAYLITPLGSLYDL